MPKDFINQLESRVANGDIHAELCLGEMYRQGTYMPSDGEKALELYKRAANQGDPTANALVALMDMYQEDPHLKTFGNQQIVSLANQGNALAEFMLGSTYLYGSVPLDITPDYAKAREWFAKAAAQDNAEAEVLLASIYGHGWGVEIDPKQAEMWSLKAADHRFDCVSDFAPVVYGLIGAHTIFPANVIKDKLPTRVILELSISKISGTAAVKLNKSSGVDVFDKAVMKAAMGLRYPVWTDAPQEVTDFLIPINYSPALLDPAADSSGVQSGLTIRKEITEQSNSLWAEHPHHTLNANATTVSFSCAEGKPQDIIIDKPSGDQFLDVNAVKIVGKIMCPTSGLQISANKRLSISIGDPWDGKFDDPLDEPQTPYGAAVRAAIASGLALPNHALMHGTIGTGVTEVSFTVTDNHIRDIVVMQSSGDREVDDAAVESVRQAKLPKAVPGTSVGDTKFIMHVNF